MTEPFLLKDLRRCGMPGFFARSREKFEKFVGARRESPVQLYLYDLSQGMARGMSSPLLGRQIEGIWHTGVVVFGKEYFLGQEVQVLPDPGTAVGLPFETRDIGTTVKTERELNAKLTMLRREFTPENYSLLNHNCNHFSEAVVQFLVGKSIGSDILNLPQEIAATPMGSVMIQMIEQLEATMRQRQANGLNPLSQPAHSASVGSGRLPAARSGVPNANGFALPPGFPSSGVNNTNAGGGLPFFVPGFSPAPANPGGLPFFVPGFSPAHTGVPPSAQGVVFHPDGPTEDIELQMALEASRLQALQGGLDDDEALRRALEASQNDAPRRQQL